MLKHSCTSQSQSWDHTKILETKILMCASKSTRKLILNHEKVEAFEWQLSIWRNDAAGPVLTAIHFTCMKRVGNAQMIDEVAIKRRKWSSQDICTVASFMRDSYYLPTAQFLRWNGNLIRIKRNVGKEELWLTEMSNGCQPKNYEAMIYGLGPEISVNGKEALLVLRALDARWFNGSKP